MSSCPPDDSVNESADLTEGDDLNVKYPNMSSSDLSHQPSEMTNSSISNSTSNEGNVNFPSESPTDTNHKLHSSVNGESSSSSEEGSCHVSPNMNSNSGKSANNVNKPSGRDSGVESTNAEDINELVTDKSETMSPLHPPPMNAANMRYPVPMPFSPHQSTSVYCPVTYMEAPGSMTHHPSMIMPTSPQDMSPIPTTGAPPVSSYQCSPSSCLPPSMHGGQPINPNYSHFVSPQAMNNQTIQTSSNSNSSTPNGSEHFVLVHVNAGETFSVRVGDGFQQIPGPATVRMVSNNGPPMPMSMQVPPGHFVQQIVDEKGILNHVILSPYPTNTNNLSPAAMPPNFCTPNGGPLLYPGGPQYPNFYPSSMNNPGPYASYVPSPAPTPLNTSNSSTNCGNTSDEKNNDAQQYRNQSKLRQVNRNVNKNSNSSATANRRKKGKSNGTRLKNDFAYQGDSSSGEENELSGESYSQNIEDVLSTMPPPKVCDMDSHSALIQLFSPEIPEDWVQEFELPLIYKLMLSDSAISGKYSCVFSGEATEISLQDLRPGTNYYLKACCMYEDFCGALSSAVSFRTKACEPNRPNPPNCSTRNRNSLSLKWTSTGDNGDKIKHFILQCSKNTNQDEFKEVFCGPQKITKVTKLQPSTQYCFRLAAVNGYGQSEWSDVVSFMTSGSVPDTPKPPLLIRRGASYLSFVWSGCCSEADEQYILQMEDKSTGHGFMPVYNGPLLQYRIDNLRRNTSYWFRLAAQNDEGQSKWSETVTYTTLPEPPEPPKSIQTKGKLHPNQFLLTWGLSDDDGGSQIFGYTLQMEEGTGPSTGNSSQWNTIYQGPEREFQLTNLTPGQTVRVRLRCDVPPSSNPELDDYQESRFSSPLSVTLPPVVPGKCQPPALVEKPKPNSVHLWWEKPVDNGGSNIANFQVFQAGSGFGLSEPPVNPATVSDDENRLVYTGRSLTCIVPRLCPGRDYRFSLRASNKAGYGPWSAWLSVRSGAGVPCPPSLLRLVHRSAGSLVIGWNKPEDNGAPVQEYRLECQYKSAGDFVLIYSGDCLQYELRNLEPATSYSVRVCAVNCTGCSVPSETLLCTTCATSPAQMQPLSLCEVNADSCLLSWQEANSQGSALTAYNIEITSSSHQPSGAGQSQQRSSSTLSVTPDTLSHTIDNLTPNTVYRFRIQAVNHVGAGPFSTPVKITTRGVPPPPPRLQLHQALSNSLKLHWEEVESNSLVHYQLEMSRQPNFNWQSVYSGPNLSHKVNKLTERTQFYFRISACNEAGQGPYSPSVSFNTTTTVPPVVKFIKVNELKPTSCRISWQPVKGIGSDPIVYVLQIVKPKCHLEHPQVFHVTEPFYHLTDLQPHTSYQARICAARSCLTPNHYSSEKEENFTETVDQTGNLQSEKGNTDRTLLNGPFSPAQEFHTPPLSGGKTVGCSARSLSSSSLIAAAGDDKTAACSSSTLYNSSPSLFSKDDKSSTASNHQHHRSISQTMKSWWKSVRTRDLSEKQIAFFVTFIFLILASLIAFLIQQCTV